MGLLQRQWTIRHTITRKGQHYSLQPKWGLVPIGQSLTVLQKKFVWHPEGTLRGLPCCGKIRVAPRGAGWLTKLRSLLNLRNQVYYFFGLLLQLGCHRNIPPKSCQTKFFTNLFRNKVTD